MDIISAVKLAFAYLFCTSAGSFAVICVGNDFQCLPYGATGDGQCIEAARVCDGVDNCANGSDEQLCPPASAGATSCPAAQWLCADRRTCVLRDWRCDGTADCPDGSDETGCHRYHHGHCGPDEIRCRDSGACLDAIYRCDGAADCDDHSDEIGCVVDAPSHCGPDGFWCSQHGHCISSGLVCDGTADCPDQSDETGCQHSCTADQFQCASACIPRQFVCDGSKDCDDGRDELNCTEPATALVCRSEDQHTCSSGHCIDSESVCDGYNDCPAGDDETDCSVCPASRQYACADGQCLSVDQVCDGYTNCVGQEDESNCTVLSPCPVAAPCQQLCIQRTAAAAGYVCGCRRGSSLQPDGHSCGDWSECSTGVACSQLCNVTSAGGFICSCSDGYRLRPDGSSCRALRSGVSRPTLLVALRHAVMHLSTSGELVDVLHKNLANVMHLDYYWSRDLLFWVDTAHSAVYSSRLNGTESTVLLSAGLFHPAGLAVDWLHSLLYWSDDVQHTLEVSSLDGSVRCTLLRADLQSPRALALYPSRALLFWTEVGENGSISRCDQDGGGRHIIVRGDSVAWPNGLTIDFTVDRIYWADARRNAIWSAALDGAQSRRVLGPVPHPFSLSVFEDTLYWTDWRLESLHSADKRRAIDGAGGGSSSPLPSGVRTLRADLQHPMDVRVLHPLRQPGSSVRCRSNAGCSHLCLPRPGGATCRCPDGLDFRRNSSVRCEVRPAASLLVACPGGVEMLPLSAFTGHTDAAAVPLNLPPSPAPSALDTNAYGTIYWADADRHAIYNALWDGTRRQQLISTNIGHVSGLACDWLTDKLYWTDSRMSRVEVATTDGRIRSVLFTELVFRPSAIVVWPEAGILFWSELGGRSDGVSSSSRDGWIERADMDGRRRDVIIPGMGSPSALALDAEANTLYWCDTVLELISSARVTRAGDVVSVDRRGPALQPPPSALALVSGRLFWTSITGVNSTSAAVRLYRLGKDGASDASVELTARPLALASLSSSARRPSDVQTFQHDCLVDNGRCSHLCLLSPDNQPSCRCPTGVPMSADGRTCEQGPAVSLLFSCRTEIRRLTLPDLPAAAGGPTSTASAAAATPDVVLPLPRGIVVVAIAWDSLHGLLYYWDVAGARRRIMSASLDGRNSRPVIVSELGTHGSIAIDPAGRKLYWCDVDRASVEVSELDGTHRQLLVSSQLQQPRSLTVSHSLGLMYWTQWTQAARIQRAWMDGSHREDVITAGLGRPSGLVIDVYRNAIYWCDNLLGTVETASLSGRQRRTLVPGLQRPFSVALHAGSLYWTEWSPSDSIRRAPVAVSNGTAHLVHQTADIDQLIMVERNRAIKRDACGPENGECGGLCLRQPNGSRCMCGTGLHLMADGLSCPPRPDTMLLYLKQQSLVRVSLDVDVRWEVTLPTAGLRNAVWLDILVAHEMVVYVDTALNQIRVLSLTDGGVSRALTTLPEDVWPVAVSVDWSAGLVVFTSSRRRGLFVVSAPSGCCLRTLVSDGVQEPRALTIQVSKGGGSSEGSRLFWADVVPPRLRIETIRLDGTGRRVLVTDRLSRPSGLATDSHRLYWSDVELGWISSCLFSGGDRRIIVQNVQHPFSIAVLSDTLYWTDWARHTLESCGKLNCQQRTTVMNGVDGVMGLVALSPASQSASSSPCAVDNGGCTHLCVYRGGDVYSCLCPDDQQMTDDCQPYTTVRADSGSDGAISMVGVLGTLALGLAGIAIMVSMVGLVVVRHQRNATPAATLTFSNPSYTTDTCGDVVQGLEHVSLVELNGVRV